MLNNRLKERIDKLFQSDIGLLLILILLSIFLSSLSPAFRSFSNMLNVIRQVSINLIVALGMTCVILTAEIDLSVGAIAALSGVVTTLVLQYTGVMAISLVAGLLSGAVFGFLNGLFTVKLRIQSFIVTLAMMSICRGLALVITKGYPVSQIPKSFGYIGSGYIGEIPVISVLAIVLFLIFLYFVQYTKHGVHIKGIGANIVAARLSAIKVDYYKILVFVLCGLFAALGGILIASRLLSGQPTAAMDMNLDVIAAVILGGTVLSGGQGTIVGTLIGCFILGVINNGLNILNVSAFVQQIVKGLIILVAVLLKRSQAYE